MTPDGSGLEHRLQVREPGGGEPRWIVVSGSVVVGRDCEGEIVNDDEVSRRHLRLTAGASGVIVTDLGSTNGTSVNGTRITGETLVRPGDVIMFGQTSLALPAPASRDTVFVAPSASRSTTTSAAVSAPPRATPDPPTSVVAPVDPVATPTAVAPVATPAPAAAVAAPTVPAPAAPAPAPVLAPPPVAPPPAAASEPRVPVASATSAHARPIGMGASLAAVTGRALRLLPRDLMSFTPPIFIAVLLYVLLEASVGGAISKGAHIDFASFVLPVALIMSVNGVTRVGSVISDIEGGYLDRMLLTSVKRPALLLGLLTVDALVVVFLCLPTLALGLIVYGVDFKTGPLGIVVFVLLAAFWGICLAGFVYALALKFPSPGLERVSALIFQPLIYIAPAFVPRDSLSGWLKAAATYNPLTYVLEGMRSLIFTGWDSTAILKALGASAIVGVVSFTLAMVALQRRLTRTTGG